MTMNIAVILKFFDISTLQKKVTKVGLLSAMKSSIKFLFYINIKNLKILSTPNKY